MDFSVILGCDTHFKSGSIHARWWRHLAYVNTSYPMSVAGLMSLYLFSSGPSNMHRCRAFSFALAGLFLLSFTAMIEADHFQYCPILDHCIGHVCSTFLCYSVNFDENLLEVLANLL